MPVAPEEGQGLEVFFEGRKAGSLSLDPSRRFVFRYDPRFLSSRDARPLSVSLPLRPEPFPDDASRPFFANLLPESGVRRAIARQLGVSDENDFALLEALGGECAGAVSLWPPGERAPEEEQGGYREVSRGEIAVLVAALPRRPLLRARAGMRLSLAGAQDKLPVLLEGGRIFVPEGGASSSHILKPAIPGLEGTVENEAFCMLLAARAGLSVPGVAVLSLPPPVLVVERYDRQRRAGRLARVHQEDFCQALGLLPSEKYESEGGPGLVRCFELIARHSSRSLLDRKALIRWVIFDALIENADGHAKNLSLLHAPEGIRLAPFYDVLCTAVYAELSRKLAMKVGGENRPDWIQKRHWERFAAEIGVKPGLVLGYCRDLARRLPGLTSAVRAELDLGLGATETIAKVSARLEKACRRMEARLEG
ncbi:MAG: type II toxin-antitoxin system HipA family toxin [Planctomycetes bacterium]|nr:type II toxin-antitoxin system HipA family toxin [Planctomycetota bacterium]